MSRSALHYLPALLLLGCLLCCTALAAKPATNPERKELIEQLVDGANGPDDKGNYHIEHEGVKWVVLESKAEDGAPLIIFVRTKGFLISYEDPRTGIVPAVPEDVAAAGRAAFAAAGPPPPIKSSDELANGLPPDATKDVDGHWFITDHEGAKHMVYKDESSGRYYFVNAATQATGWTDPRKTQPPPQDIEDDQYEDPDEVEDQSLETNGETKDEL